MIDDTLDLVVVCVGLVWLIGLAIFGAGGWPVWGGARGRPARAWPWVVGVPTVLILSCLAYFLFGGP